MVRPSEEKREWCGITEGCSEGVTQGTRVLLLHPNASFLEARLVLQLPHAWVLLSLE